jgi:hypothetical protein
MRAWDVVVGLFPPKNHESGREKFHVIVLLSTKSLWGRAAHGQRLDLDRSRSVAERTCDADGELAKTTAASLVHRRSSRAEPS